MKHKLPYFESGIRSFRAQWIEKRYGKNIPMYLSVDEQNKLAEDYAHHMVQGERLSWKIVFVILIVFIFIVYAG